jgi:arylsulfatase A-like enzyme
VSRTPSGNVDVAPTILHLLGIKPPKRMDGRVLFEALASCEAKPPAIEQRRKEVSVKVPGGKWTQHLSVKEVNGVRYLDEGNGEFMHAR